MSFLLKLNHQTAKELAGVTKSPIILIAARLTGLLRQCCHTRALILVAVAPICHCPLCQTSLGAP
jgi:hypothetical protein